MDSGVTENTTRVFLESAYFNPVSVRKTAKRHGLKTDASFRFERGTDPNITVLALERRSEEHTSELQSLMRISYAVFCLKKKKTHHHTTAMTHKTNTDTHT